VLSVLLLGCGDRDPLDPTSSSKSTSESASGSESAGGTGSSSGGASGSGTSLATSTSTSTDPGTTSTSGPPTTDQSETNGGPGPEVDCSGLPPGVVGVPYMATLEAQGQGPPYDWTFAGMPPAWLVLTPHVDDSTYADFTGTPDEAGTFMFSLEVFGNWSESPGYAFCELVIAAAAHPS